MTKEHQMDTLLIRKKDKGAPCLNNDIEKVPMRNSTASMLKPKSLQFSIKFWRFLSGLFKVVALIMKSVQSSVQWYHIAIAILSAIFITMSFTSIMCLDLSVQVTSARSTTSALTITREISFNNMDWGHVIKSIKFSV